MVDPTVVTLAAMGVGGIVWAVRLEGRVDAHEKVDATVHAAVQASLTDITARSIRMEDKLDTVVTKLIPQSGTHRS